MLRLVSRIRFSLRTFFLALLVLSLIGSHLYVSFKWRQAQTDVQRLRDELGYLTIDDPTQFYVRETSGLMGERLSWRWRIYLPPAQWHLHVATGQIEEDNYSGGAVMPSGPPQGEFTLRANLERNDFGGWSLVVSYPGGGDQFPIMPLHTDWRYSGFYVGPSQPGPGQRKMNLDIAGSGKHTESFLDDDRVVLLRLRAPTAEQAANKEPCDGVMIWFETAAPTPTAKRIGP